MVTSRWGRRGGSPLGIKGGRGRGKSSREGRRRGEDGGSKAGRKSARVVGLVR